MYVSGTALSTTTVQSNGTWVLTGVLALATGALITATALAPTKSVSDLSNEVEVGGFPTCGTAMPVITCSSDRGIFGTAAPGALVYLRFPNGNLVPSGGSKQIELNPVTATNAGNFYFTTHGGNTTDCTNGQPNALLGTYLMSQIGGGNSCESSPTLVCIGTAATTASPVVTTPRPITASTTSLTGTAPTGAIVTLAVDGNRYSSATATASGIFTFSGASMPPLTTGRVLTLTAAENNISCSSAPVTLNVVTVRTVVPPVVDSPLITGATIVTGTSVEAPGSTITLNTYTNTTGTGMATGTFTTMVQTNGTWSVPVTALAVNTSVKATVTPVDYHISGFSNVVPVQNRTSSVPVITGTYIEKGTSVNGTSAAPVGSIIIVYIDGGFPIGTTTVQADGTWMLTGLSDGTGTGPAAFPTLYAGGLLTATSTETGKMPSLLSNQVQVGCANIANESFSAAAVCVNNAATFSIPNVEPGIVYSLQNATTGTDLPTGVSRLGTGAGTLTLVTNVFDTAGPYSIKLNAFSIGAINCSNTSAFFSLTVNSLPLARTVSAQNSNLTNYQTAREGIDIMVQNSETGVSYQLFNTSVSPNTTVGPPKNGTGSTLSLPTGGLDTSRNGSTSFTVIGTSVPGCTQTVGTQAITYGGPLPVELVAFEVKAVLTNAALTWRTASEKNNDHFDVERSFDGTDFVKVVQVQGKGDKTSSTDYNLIDTGVGVRAKGAVYYRLKQVDTDSTATYSPVRAVTFTAPRKRQISVYPLPATAATGATLDLTTLPNGSYQVQLVDLMGRILATYRLAGTQLHRLDVQALPASTYMVRVTGQDVQLNARFVKE